jgi:hypothetical protein
MIVFFLIIFFSKEFCKKNVTNAQLLWTSSTNAVFLEFLKAKQETKMPNADS